MPDDGRLGSVARRLAATRREQSIEDERDIADFLRAYFRASGYDLVHVDPDTTLEVLDAIDEHRPDCVLLDLGLRGFNGAEAYRLLRTEDRYAYTPVIVVSARSDAGRLVDPAAGGLDAIVSKPFNVNTLADLVAERIERAEKLREIGHNDALDLPSPDYLEARLSDEVALAQESGAPVTFALVRLRSLPEIVRTAGDDGTAYVVRDLLRRARDLLTGDAVLALSRRDELAIVLPDTDETRAIRRLGDALHAIGTTTRLPGGADVPVELSCGLATFPTHALDADGLYMAADAALADAVDRRERLVVSL
jgi:PleD family two-component response regulator